MENKLTGYTSKQYEYETKRYCQTLDLKDDPKLIGDYIERHRKGKTWPIILKGIKEVGILEMEIYLLDNRLFMIVETPLDFDWEEAFAKLATLPQQDEWEKYMSIFQNVKSGATSAQKWNLMERIFKLYE